MSNPLLHYQFDNLKSPLILFNEFQKDLDDQDVKVQGSSSKLHTRPDAVVQASSLANDASTQPKDSAVSSMFEIRNEEIPLNPYVSLPQQRIISAQNQQTNSKKLKKNLKQSLNPLHAKSSGLIEIINIQNTQNQINKSFSNYSLLNSYDVVHEYRGLAGAKGGLA